jgi:hypothetical protein
MSAFPPIAALEQIRERLHIIFPEGSPNRDHSVWELSARTIFVMLYVGAVELRDTWMRPDQVLRMTDEQVSAQMKPVEQRGKGSREKAAKEKSRGVGLQLGRASLSVTIPFAMRLFQTELS